LFITAQVEEEWKILAIFEIKHTSLLSDKKEEFLSTQNVAVFCVPSLQNVENIIKYSQVINLNSLTGLLIFKDLGLVVN